MSNILNRRVYGNILNSRVYVPKYKCIYIYVYINSHVCMNKYDE